jgi:hypothetical protein
MVSRLEYLAKNLKNFAYNLLWTFMYEIFEIIHYTIFGEISSKLEKIVLEPHD